MKTTIPLNLNRQQYIDELADLKSEFQHARNVGAKSVLPQIVSDMNYCQTMINSM